MTLVNLSSYALSTHCPPPPCYTLSALPLLVMIYLCPLPPCDALSLPSPSLWCSVSALPLLVMHCLCPPPPCDALSLPSPLLVMLCLCPPPPCDALSLPSPSCDTLSLPCPSFLTICLLSPSLWRSISAFSSLRRCNSCMLDTMAGNFSSSWLHSRISRPIQSCNVFCIPKLSNKSVGPFMHKTSTRQLTCPPQPSPPCPPKKQSGKSNKWLLTVLT